MKNIKVHIKDPKGQTFIIWNKKGDKDKNKRK